MLTFTQSVAVAVASSTDRRPMIARALRVSCLFALACLFAGPAIAKRIALVIGNDSYTQVARLEKAGSDANSMARELEASGFTVMRHRDLNFKQMVVAFEAFFDLIKGGDDVAVFYAGHGVQTDRGSYLLPIDVEGETQSQIEKISYSVNGLLEELDKVKPRFSLIIVDACRDNPLRSRGRTIGVARGLNAPDLAKGQMVVFSAGRNQKALDSLDEKDANPNGVFTREFVTRMRRPGLSVEALALEVKGAVERLARSVNHDQRPLIVNDSTGDFYFVEPRSGAATATAPAATAENQSAREDQFWLDTKAPDNVEGFEAYLVTYPNGRYAGLARANIARLRTRNGGQQPAAPVSNVVALATPSPSVKREQILEPTRPPAASAASTGATTPGPVPGPVGNASVLASYTLTNGDRYEGEVVGVFRTGKGRYLFANGDRYEGELQDNVFNGRGVMTYKSGDRYEGDYVRGVKHGQGDYRFANKDRFTGGFASDQYDGKGSFFYANGNQYDGNYVRGMKHGQGVLQFTNKDRYTGGFVGDMYEGKGSFMYSSGDLYQGDYVRGMKEGAGVYRFANGDRYEGAFLNDKFTGLSKLLLANGDRYEGEFRDNLKQGAGVHYFVNGDRYEGEFKAGVQAGTGTHSFVNGDKYVGRFERGVRHGKGVYHFANNQQKEVEYVDGIEKGN